VVDDRLPGALKLQTKPDQRVVPGCKKSGSSVATPDCPEHEKPMVLVASAGR
jgi:hypothetical protein